MHYVSLVYKSSAVAEISDHLATADMGQKLGLCPFFGEFRPIQPFGHNRHGQKFGGSWVPSNTMLSAEAYLFYQVASCSIQPFCHIRHGPKIGGYAPFFEGAASPSNTKSPWPRPISVPSGILIIQPFGHSRHRPKMGGLCPLFWGGSWVSI